MKQLTILGVILIAFALITAYIFSGSKQCTAYSCLRFPGMNRWKLSEVYEQSDKVWRGLLRDSDMLIRLERVSGTDPGEAADFTKIRIMKMQGLFDNARSPYPGAISDEIVCQNKYKPVVKTIKTTGGIDVTYFSAYYNNRLQVGSCIDDQVAYTGTVLLFYCPDIRQWYQVERMSPAAVFPKEALTESQLKDVGCSAPKVGFGLTK